MVALNFLESLYTIQRENGLIEIAFKCLLTLVRQLFFKLKIHKPKCKPCEEKFKNYLLSAIVYFSKSTKYTRISEIKKFKSINNFSSGLRNILHSA